MASHLENYLSYYKTCASPGYAVLVTGEWGVGKTHQIKAALPPKERCYVSLFGLQSAAEVHSAVFAASHPSRSKIKMYADRAREYLNRPGSLFALAGLSSDVLNAILLHNIRIDSVLIFDDLERSSIDLKDLLGAINTYVEHRGCRVVVIAHDSSLAEDFLTRKEKIFGHTIKVEPMVAEAFKHFCSSLPAEEKRRFLEQHEADILTSFESSKIKSLRILKHAIEDLSRLHSALLKRHTDHSDAMVDLVRLFSAISLEVRAGNLTETDLASQDIARAERHQIVPAQDQPHRHKLVLADEKHLSADLFSDLLDKDVVIQMVIEGRYSPQRIQQSLDNSRYFAKPDKVPPWKVVIGFDELDNDVVEQGVKRMEQQFENREVVESGEILHIFALRMLMSEQGMLEQQLLEVVDACKSYVDDLLLDQRLPPRELEYNWYDHFQRAHGGYVYWTTDTTSGHFQELANYLLEARVKALEAQFPKMIDDLLKLMERDGFAFCDQICHLAGSDGRYALIPVLCHIPPEMFVDNWMRSPRVNWRWISKGLSERYNANRLANELKAENEWIGEVVRLLNNEAEKVTGFEALRIRRTIPSFH